VQRALINASGTLVPHRSKTPHETAIPTIAYIPEFAEAGTSLTYGVNLSEFVGRAAIYVDKILRAFGVPNSP
jgi:hypothetical protein